MGRSVCEHFVPIGLNCEDCKRPEDRIKPLVEVQAQVIRELQMTVSKANHDLNRYAARLNQYRKALERIRGEAYESGSSVWQLSNIADEALKDT